jgi:hypothetical protein
VSDLKPDRQRRDLHKSNLPVTSRKIGPVLIKPQPPFQGNSNFNSNYNLNQPSLRDLVLGQAKINENLTKNISNNDKILEKINTKPEGLSATV